METQFSNIQITLKICLHFDKERYSRYYKILV